METISESTGLPIWTLVILASSIVSWSITEIVKKSVIAYQKENEEKAFWWWNTLFRTIPLVVGSLLGWQLESDLGWLLGFTGGAFCTTIVAIFKSYLKKIHAKTKEDAP